MGTVWSIRGTNGSGKTTLARRFLPLNLSGDRTGGPVDLNWYPSPTKKDPDRKLQAEGYCRYFYDPSTGTTSTVGVVGSYKTACGGMDRMPSFGVCQDAISYMLNQLKPPCDHVIAEGILASGVYGSWGTFARNIEADGHRFAFCYLQTPLEICKERVLTRQREKGVEKTINWQLLEDKYDNVISNRRMALAAGELVYDLPYGNEASAFTLIMRGLGEEYRGC